MKLQRSYLGPFLVASIVSGVLTNSFDANARYQRQHAFACQTFHGAPIDTGFSIQNDSTTSRMQAVCPFLDGDSFPANFVITRSAQGEDGSNVEEVSAMNCYNLIVNGGGCSAQVSTTVNGTGSYSLAPPVAWGPAVYAYTWIDLPKKTAAGSRSSLRGVTALD